MIHTKWMNYAIGKRFLVKNCGCFRGNLLYWWLWLWDYYIHIQIIV